MNRFYFLVACLATSFLLAACGRPELTGKWMQPVPGQPGVKQGLVLEKNGKASSVNMATMKYDAWKQDSDKLIISGKSIGNHQAAPFYDTLVIERLTPDSLILRKGMLTLSYARE